MSLDDRFKDVLDGLKTQLISDYPSASVYIGDQTNTAEKTLDISIRGGSGITDGQSGIWRYPLRIVVNTHASDNLPEDAVENIGDVMQTIKEYFSSNNTEPLDASGHWGQVLRMDPVLFPKPVGYYNRFVIRCAIYFYEAGFGTLGTIRLQYSTYDITLSAAIEVDWSISKPETVFTPTSNSLPSGIDRRSYFSDYRINAIIIGSTARTTAKLIVDLMKEQFGSFSSNYITMTFSGALASIYGSSFNVVPSTGSQIHIKVRDGEQFLVKVSNLSLREVRT